MSEDVDAAELVHQLSLEAGPVGDVHESTSLAHRESIQY